MKRLISVLLFCLLLFSSMPVAFAADASAATLRLQKTEGAVSVQNQNGRSVSMLDGMRLYSGYTVATEAESYAHISLDNTKAIKLDASSEVQVCKSGSKLELHLVSGSLLCDVSKTLSDNESLSIRTSTTITGIRGTTVFFRQTESGVTEVYVLHGTITLTTNDPLTGESRQVTVTTGQIATVSPQSEVGQPQMEVDSFNEEDIPGYVGIELAENEELHQRLTSQGTGQDLSLIIRNAEDKLQNDRKEAERRQQELDHASNAEKQNSNPFFGGIVNIGNGGGSGGNGGGSSPTSITLPAGSTETDLRNALQNYNDIILSNCSYNEGQGGTDYSITLTSTLEIPEGKTLTLGNSTLHNPTGISIDSEGTLILNNGSLIQNYGLFTNDSTLNLNSGSILENYGTATNNGTINLTGESTLVNYATVSNYGAINIYSGSNISNYSHYISEQSSIPSTLINQSDGEITVNAGCVLYNNGDEGQDASPTGCTLTNLGTITINADGTLNNIGIFNSEGTFYVHGTYSDTGIQCYIVEKSILEANNNKVVFRGNAFAIETNDVADDRKLVLLKDIEGLSQALQDISTNLTLDLNGHTLTLNDAPLNVNSAGTLTIMDSSDGETGTITGTGTLITSAGTLVVNSGTISVGTTEATGILITSGTFTMNDGTILVGSDDANFGTGVNVEGSASSFILNGGNITATGDYSKGVFLSSTDVTFTIGNGVVIGEGDYSCGVYYISGLDISTLLQTYVDLGKISTTNGLATYYQQLC